MSSLSWIAFGFSVTGVWLNARKRRSCWVVWSVGTALWLVYAARTGQRPLCLMQAVFLLANGYGWREWRKEK